MPVTTERSHIAEKLRLTGLEYRQGSRAQYCRGSMSPSPHPVLPESCLTPFRPGHFAYPARKSTAVLASRPDIGNNRDCAVRSKPIRPANRYPRAQGNDGPQGLRTSVPRSLALASAPSRLIAKGSTGSVLCLESGRCRLLLGVRLAARARRWITVADTDTDCHSFYNATPCLLNISHLVERGRTHFGIDDDTDSSSASPWVPASR